MSVPVWCLQRQLQEVTITIIMLITMITIMEAMQFLKLIRTLMSTQGLMTRVKGQHVGIELRLTRCFQWKMLPK